MFEIIKNIPLLAQIPSAEIKIEKLAGLTNNNYQITTPEQIFILRIPRAETNININREHEFANANMAYQLGLSPKILWQNNMGMSLCKYLEDASVLTPDKLKSPQTLERISLLLQTLQHSKRCFEGELNTHKISRYLNSYYKLCTPAHQQTLQADYQTALKRLENLDEKREPVPAHIDLVPENILQQNEKLWLIDWEYSAMASPYWDLATLCNAGGFDQTSEQHLLESIFKDYTEEDRVYLGYYRKIVKSVSDCWLCAYQKT